MKKKIVDKKTGKVVREFEVRDYSILVGQINNPHLIQKNKKKYTRKQKYKKKYIGEEI